MSVTKDNCTLESEVKPGLPHPDRNGTGPNGQFSAFPCHQMLVSRDLGGAGLIALHTADHLRREGRLSEVWIPGRGPARQEAERMGLSVNDYSPLAVRHLPAVLGAYLNFRLASKLWRAGGGLVHVHSPYYYAAFRHGFAMAGLKRVVHVHLEEDKDGLRWAFRSPPELIVTCARFLVEHTRQCLPERWRDRQRIVAVPNAVDTVRFSPAPKEPAKQRVGAPADRPLAVMLANLAPQKGQEIAIRATALLKTRGVAIACWLAGTERGGAGTYTAKLEALCDELGVRDAVRFLGHRADAPDLLRAADFLLLPSTSEGLPLSVLEAQATRVPVLAAPTAGIPEVVTDGQTGFLIPADDAGGYACRIGELIACPESYHRVADQAYARARNEYTWDTYCRRILALYDELLVEDDVPLNGSTACAQ